MNFFTTTLIIALVTLLICCIHLYWNFPRERQIHPHAMTTCPDNWEATPDGKCIIPSADLPNANIGRLIDKKFPLYEYKYIENGEIKFGHNTAKTVQKQDNPNEVYDTWEYKDRQGNRVYGYDIVDKEVKKNSLVPPESFDPDNKDWPITIDFFSDDWNYFNGVNSRVCQIKKWAQKNRIAWDGLENYNQCSPYVDVSGNKISSK